MDLKSPFPHLLYFLIILFIAIGCRPTEELPDDRQLYYHQQNPLSEVDELEEVIDGIERILVSAHYDNYFFEEDDRITLEDIKEDPELLEEADSDFDIETKAGTGIVIDVANGHPLILTTNHLIDQPDTLTFFYEDDFGDETGIGELSIADRKERYLPSARQLGELEVLVSDEQNDVALLTTENPYDLDDPMNEFSIRGGDSRNLDWGSKVFTIGYPLGNHMLSTASVSEPNRDDYGSFIIDALFNPGFSGGAVLAVNNDNHRLELVGMARSASASSDFVLRPQHGAVSPHQDGVRYDGPLFAEFKRDINYGIVHSISIIIIKNIIQEHRDVLDEYDFEPFES